MSEGTSKTGFIPRFLVMIYGLGIVILGLHPLEQEHGDLWKYLSSETEHLLERDWIPTSWKNRDGIEISIGDPS